MTVRELEAIIRRAGRYVLGATDQTASSLKSNVKDFVTVADIKAQNIIVAGLQSAFPDEAVISEESPESDQRALYEANFTGFVVDPIDGTYNFKRGMGESAISIGYIREGEPVLGVVYNPYKDELYAAMAGKGATCNGQAITVSAQAGLKGAAVATSNSYDDGAMARNLRRHLAIFDQTGAMPWTSCLGSGVLIMTNVACGRIDAYHHNGLKPWDNAAAFLIIREAGGVVESLRSGGPAHFTEAAVLLGNRPAVAALRAVFGQIDQELLN